MTELIVSYLSNHPYFAVVVSVLGIFRAFVPPLQLIWRLTKELVGMTPTKFDDRILRTIERSKILSGLAYVASWLTSIELTR